MASSPIIKDNKEIIIVKVGLYVLHNLDKWSKYVYIDWLQYI